MTGTLVGAWFTARALHRRMHLCFTVTVTELHCYAAVLFAEAVSCSRNLPSKLPNRNRTESGTQFLGDPNYDPLSWWVADRFVSSEWANLMSQTHSRTVKQPKKLPPNNSFSIISWAFYSNFVNLNERGEQQRGVIYGGRKCRHSDTTQYTWSCDCDRGENIDAH